MSSASFQIPRDREISQKGSTCLKIQKTSNQLRRLEIRETKKRRTTVATKLRLRWTDSQELGGAPKPMTRSNTSGTRPRDACTAPQTKLDSSSDVEGWSRCNTTNAHQCLRSCIPPVQDVFDDDAMKNDAADVEQIRLLNISYFNGSWACFTRISSSNACWGLRWTFNDMMIQVSAHAAADITCACMQVES